MRVRSDHSARKPLAVPSILPFAPRNRLRGAIRLALCCVLGLGLSLPAFAQSDSDPLTQAKAAAETARQELEAAEKALAEAKAGVEQNADKAAAEQAVSEKEKALAEKTKAVGRADEVLRAQETFAADKAVVETQKALPKAEQAARDAQAASQKAVAEADAARAARDQAATEKTAAQEAVATASEDAKAAAEKTLAEKEAALKSAEERLQAAQAAADKAGADKNARAEEAARAAEAVLQARERAAQAKAAALGGLKPLAASEWNYEKARHLLFRAGLGGSPEEVARLHEMGLFAAVDYLVDYHHQPEPAGWFDAFPHRRTAPYERHLNEAQRAQLDSARVSFRWEQHHRLRRAWLQRLVETERPLQEKLTLFWHGHFACSYLAAEDSYSMWQQNEMFRRRAAGNFGALLHGIAHDPAMIRYLDNHLNFKGSGNENLGREILELFSMGEGQGYTEQDLAEAARALSGYNFEYHNGQFKFVASRHDTGEKTLFGKKGNFGGDELVDLILQQPATSRYICGKLFRFFAHENPDEETVEKMAAVLRGCQYELEPMLRNFFCSEEFYSERSLGSHIKSPVELTIGAIRTLKLTNVDYGSLDSTVSEMGQRLFEPPNVAGWDGGRAWIDASSLLLRYNALANLVDKADLAAMLQANRATEPAAAVDYLARAFLCVPLSDAKRQELLNHLGELPPADQWNDRGNEINARLRAVLVALVSLPEYQLAQAAPTPAPRSLEVAVASY